MATSTMAAPSIPHRSAPGLNLAYTAFALLCGSNFMFVKWAISYISPPQIVLLCVLFDFLPLLAYALATRALHRRDWRHAHHFVMMAVLATAFCCVAFSIGTALLLSSVAHMMSGSIPLFTFLAALVFLREKPINRHSIGGTVLGSLDILLISRPWNLAGGLNLAGVFWTIAGSS